MWAAVSVDDKKRETPKPHPAPEPVRGWYQFVGEQIFRKTRLSAKTEQCPGSLERHDFRKKAFYNSDPQKSLLKTSKKTLAPRLALITNCNSKGNT
jgi:hypothetical protein